MPKPLLWIVTAAFGAYSFWALAQVGYLGLWQGGFANIGATQITLDLIVSSILLIGFVARDCKAQGRAWWPWALATVLLGSFGTLGYLLWPQKAAAQAANAGARPVSNEA